MANAPAKYRTQSIITRPARGTTADRGYGSRWQRTSQGFIAAFPICCGCDPADESKMKLIAEQSGMSLMDTIQLHSRKMRHAANCDGLATQVDHLVAVTDRYDSRFYDVDNLRGRSAACHSFKTRLCDMGGRENRGAVSNF